jgi:hypothetical protein
VAIADLAARVIAHADDRSLIAAIVSGSIRHDALARRFSRRLLNLRRDELRAVLERGIALEIETAVDCPQRPGLPPHSPRRRATEAGVRRASRRRVRTRCGSGAG